MRHFQIFRGKKLSLMRHFQIFRGKKLSRMTDLKIFRGKKLSRGKKKRRQIILNPIFFLFFNQFLQFQEPVPLRFVEFRPRS